MARVQPSFFEIYTENPKVCSLLILKSKEDNNKIIGRALVWQLKDPQITLMDRVYYTNDSEMQLFRDYAKFKKWHYKHYNDSSSLAIAINPEGEEARYSSFNVDIRSGEYDKYPYVDTLKYYNEDTGLLTSDDDEYGTICLEDTSGGYEGQEGSCNTCDGEGTIECSRCDGDGEVDCEECDGSGDMTCTKCDGDGEVECKYCDGTGENEDDEDGKCYHCDGTGMRNCKKCERSGQIECDRCEGSRQMECDRCDGNGRVDCPDCN
jgi:hypothetical protein